MTIYCKKSYVTVLLEVTREANGGLNSIVGSRSLSPHNKEFEGKAEKFSKAQ